MLYCQPLYCFESLILFITTQFGFIFLFCYCVAMAIIIISRIIFTREELLNIRDSTPSVLCPNFLASSVDLSDPQIKGLGHTVRRRRRRRGKRAGALVPGPEWGHFSAREFQAQDRRTFSMEVEIG